MSAQVPELVTERLRLRSLREEDTEALWPSFSDPDAMRYWGRGPFQNRGELRDWLFDPDWTGRTWIAEPLEGGTAVARLIAHTEKQAIAEVGYLVALGHQRQGIGRECMTALIDHLIQDENVRRIWADIDPRNDASNRLIESLGFTKEGRLREAMETHIGWCDSLIWGLLAREWAALADGANPKPG